MDYKIGDFSRLCRVTVRTLRYYDEIGLLKPVRVDKVTGYRYYSLDQIPKLNRIIMLKGLGLVLDDINELIHNGMATDYIRQLLHVKKSEIQERIDQDKEKLRQVDSWLNRVTSKDSIPADIFIGIKMVPSMTVISKREHGTYEETIPRLFAELRSYLEDTENNEMLTIIGPVTGLFYDEEYMEKDADIEVIIPVSGEPSVINDSIQIKTLPAFEVISAIHKGSYNNMENIYAQIIQYTEENHLHLSAPARELYFTYMQDVPEEEYLTEIQCPFHRLVQ